MPALALLYQGVKHAWKYNYVPPALPKGLRGMSGWSELRDRHPSPANSQSNGPYTSRELQRGHHKTPYYNSRYIVRNYWEFEKEVPQFIVCRHAPPLESFTPERLAKHLGFIVGDEAGNQRKLTQHKALLERINQENQPFYEEFPEAASLSNMELMHSARQEIENIRALDEWGDMGDFPGASEYMVHPDTFLHTNGLQHWSSYDQHIYIELEKMIEEIRDSVLEEGQDVIEGNSSNWKVLDSRHRRDQQQEVMRTLKQRNVDKLE